MVASGGSAKPAHAACYALATPCAPNGEQADTTSANAEMPWSRSATDVPRALHRTFQISGRAESAELSTPENPMDPQEEFIAELNQALAATPLLSGLPLPEPQGHSSAFAVAGGWVPVSLVELLLATWEIEAADDNWNGHIRSTYGSCAKEGRAMLARWNERQQAPNNPVSHTEDRA